MPQEILRILLEEHEFFAGLLLEHLVISMLAIGIAVVIGGAAGILIGEFSGFAKPALGLVNFLYTIPSISMLGFLIPFSGVGNATAVIALTVYALLPMVRNTYAGMTTVDPTILEAARGMGSTRGQVLFKIRLPLAAPVILSGIRSMATMTIALAGIASFIGAGGLGVAVYRGITTNQADMTMAGSILIASLALAVDGLFGFLERRIKNRGAKAKKQNHMLALAVLLVFLTVFTASILHPKQGETIRIATKPMTEQYILGEMLDILIEQDTDLNVEVTQGVGGGTSNIQPAMENGEFDLYPEYTGTGWNMVLKKDGIYTEELFDELEQEYEEDYSMQWIGMYGFNNTYGLAVRKKVAEQYNLKRYSDLAAVSDQLVFGAEYDFFEREDGYEALCDAYDLHFKRTMDLDIGLKYQALNQGKIDVMAVFTTDGQLSAADAVVLTDDKDFYPSYLCGNVVRREVLEAHPELASVFEKLTGIISDSEMAQMNYEVETEGKTPRETAESFLIRQGILE